MLIFYVIYIVMFFFFGFVHFGTLVLENKKVSSIQCQKKCNFEAQYLKTAQNADRTL